MVIVGKCSPYGDPIIGTILLLLLAILGQVHGFQSSVLRISSLPSLVSSSASSRRMGTSLKAASTPVARPNSAAIGAATEKVHMHILAFYAVYLISLLWLSGVGADQWLAVASRSQEDLVGLLGRIWRVRYCCHSSRPKSLLNTFVCRSNIDAGQDAKSYEYNMNTFLNEVKSAAVSPFQFQSFHKAIRQPLDYYTW
jgi:hypothetical protein